MLIDNAVTFPNGALENEISDDDDRINSNDLPTSDAYTTSENANSSGLIDYPWKPVTLKLNSVELYVTGGSTIEDSSSNNGDKQQKADQHVDNTTSNFDAEPEKRNQLDYCNEKAESTENENDDSSERSLKGFEDIEKLVEAERTSSVTERQSPLRLQWLEHLKSKNWENEWKENVEDLPACSVDNFEQKMQSAGELTTINGKEKNRKTTMTDEMENDFQAEPVVVVSEMTPENRKTEWEKLQDRLQRVPRRRSMYDLFYENDGDILRNLFKKKKPPLLFHFSESSSSSMDSY
ncbi:myb-like protein V [Wyeomyia smithii]|uniref:myb-like protein V n=1 Tax=Wyeomyia smithii TaxID=174621 RepID=UPI002467F83C|nr:myb-like protein V [Wyeomyia smithii]